MKMKDFFVIQTINLQYEERGVKINFRLKYS